MLDGGSFDDLETQTEITSEHIQWCFQTYWPAIAVFLDLDAGIVHLTLDQYLLLQWPFVEAWHVWKAEVGKRKRDEQRKRMAQLGNR